MRCQFNSENMTLKPKGGGIIGGGGGGGGSLTTSPFEAD
jgi:hypothetical protein